MASNLNFLNWRLGHEARWPVRLHLSDALPDLDVFAKRTAETLYRRWGVVRDGQRLTIDVGSIHATLEFLRPADLRAARWWLKRVATPFLQRIELPNPWAEEPEGELCFMRTALPGQIRGQVHVVLGPEVNVPLAAAERHAGGVQLSLLARDCPLDYAGRPLLVAASPLLSTDGITGGTANVVLFLGRGDRLSCHIEGSEGAEYLVVESWAEGERQAANGRLFELDTPPRFVATPPRGAGADLTPLRPMQQSNLAFWVDYERQAFNREIAVYERRRAAPLEYDHVDQDEIGGSWSLRLVNGQQALQHWPVEADAQSSREVAVDAAVELHAAVADRGICRATLDSLREDQAAGRAWVRVRTTDSAAVPPSMGKVVAVEDRGRETQRDRRNRALAALQSGQTASPDLLAWLLAPSTVPAINAREGEAYRRTGTARRFEGEQARAIRGAVRSEGLFLIQGPPGTGKTSVIVEIVHALRERYRKQGEEHQPLRVLISSLQNDAIENAVERLLADRTGLQVQTTHLRNAEEFAMLTAGKAQEIARSLRRSAQCQQPEFKRYEALRDLERRLAALRSAVGEMGLVSTTGDLLRGIATVPEASALLPSLRDDLEALERMLRVQSSGSPGHDDRGDPRLRRALTVLAEYAPPTDAAAWQEALALLDALDEAMPATPGRDDALATAWRGLRRNVRTAIRDATEATKLTLEWEEHSQRTRTLFEQRAEAVEEDGFHDVAQLKQVSEWVERAVREVGRDLTAAHATVEAALYDWLHALENEPGQIARTVDSYAPVVAATCQRADGTVDASREEANLFDVAIIDEAARAGLDVLIPMCLARAVVLVGDQNQLPPYVEDVLVSRVEQGVVELGPTGESLFAHLWRQLPETNRVALDLQYRMHEEIGRVVSRVFYEPQITLRHYYGGERAEERAPRYGLVHNWPLAWIDTQDVLKEGRRTSEWRWPCAEDNAYEAALVMRLLQLADEAALAEVARTTPHRPVGVITFYQRQRQRIQDSLLMGLPPSLHALVEVATVDSVQGREFPLVLLSCVRSNARGMVGFLNKLPQRINVAMSRAQRQLIVLGDASTLASATPGTGSPWLRDVYELLAAQQRVLPSAILGL